MPAYRQPEARVNNSSTGIAENGDEAPPAPPRSGQRVGKCWVPGRTGTPCEMGKARIGGDMTSTEAWRKLKPGPAKVLHVLWEAAGGAMQTDTGEVFLACRISLAKLSERSGYSTRSVSRHIGTLRRAGFVDVVSTGRTNGFNVVPFPEGFVSDLASQDGHDRRASMDEFGAPDTPKLARPHIPSRVSPPDNPIEKSTTSAPLKRKPTVTHKPTLDAGGVVVEHLLYQRGITEGIRRRIAERVPVLDAVRACAAFDAGELQGPGGLVRAIEEAWELRQLPEIYIRRPSKEEWDKLVQDALRWYNQEKIETIEAVLVHAEAIWGYKDASIESTDESLWVNTHALCRAMEWWFDDKTGAGERSVWREVVLLARPDLCGAGPEHKNVILNAFRIREGLALLASNEALVITGIRPNKPKLSTH